MKETELRFNFYETFIDVLIWDHYVSKKEEKAMHDLLTLNWPTYKIEYREKILSRIYKTIWNP